MHCKEALGGNARKKVQERSPQATEVATRRLQEVKFQASSSFVGAQQTTICKHKDPTLWFQGPKDGDCRSYVSEDPFVYTHILAGGPSHVVPAWNIRSEI